jgi:hypothetical protein
VFLFSKTFFTNFFDKNISFRKGFTLMCTFFYPLKSNCITIGTFADRIYLPKLEEKLQILEGVGGRDGFGGTGGKKNSKNVGQH